jgi:hypothetical protein
MATLRAAGALQAAEQFPDEIDLDALRAMTLGGFQPRIEAAELIASIDSGRDPELHDAAMSMMAQPMPPYPGAPPRTDTPDFRRRHNTLLLSVMRDRLPWPPEDAIGMPRGAGLVRVVDRRRQLHVYGVGRVPPGELVGELGRLPSEGARGLAPLWITAGGYLTTEEARVAPRPASPAAAARWALAPLAWPDVDEPLAERVRASLGRLAVVRRERRREPRSAEPVATVAHIHRDDNGGARPTLYSAVHSVTGDQLLTTNRFEAGDLGYGDPLVLGYLDPDAPVTGRLGTSRPRIPWASRFGLRVRGPDGRIA